MFYLNKLPVFAFEILDTKTQMCLRVKKQYETWSPDLEKILLNNDDLYREFSSFLINNFAVALIDI